MRALWSCLLLALVSVSAYAATSGGMPSKPKFTDVTVTGGNGVRQSAAGAASGSRNSRLRVHPTTGEISQQACSDDWLTCENFLTYERGGAPALTLTAAAVSVFGDSTYLGSISGTTTIESQGNLVVSGGGYTVTSNSYAQSTVNAYTLTAGSVALTTGGAATLNALPIATEDTNTFTWTMTGVTAGVYSTGTAYYSKVGDVACINWHNDNGLLGGTSTGTSKQLSGMPAKLNARGLVTGTLAVQDNGGAWTIGLWQTMTGNNIELFPGPGGGNWTASGEMRAARFVTCWTTD